MPNRNCLLACIVIAWSMGQGRAADAAPPLMYDPVVAPASDEGRRAIAGFRVPEGMRVDLAAAEPLVANPVAFCFDRRGRIFVAETFRQQRGVEDNRGHRDWLLDDLRAQSVDDRVAYFRKHLGDSIITYTLEHDRIRRLSDDDEDGTYESATVFADGFNRIEDGTGAGVLAWNGSVYYTCIPKLYRLRDRNDDGVADSREVLHEGYGVRVAFRGHDMHGLIVGPDGRIYYSIGDRGYNVLSQEGRRLKRPDTGAVFRCEPDGSNLEVFAYGLRNPQELAFDDFGNLFTGDNNSDSGDQARWVYVVEGGDSGWRMYYQYLADRGPWNRERMWYRYRSDDETAEKQPAYIVPPIANLGDGPSGLVYYPGVGLPKRYDGHFFLADFRGGSSNSGIRSFSVKQHGATFELTDSHEFLWSILATDVDFGYDGSLYVTDWVNGWEGIGKGRIYRVTDEAEAKQAAGIADLMKGGFAGLNDGGLVELLNHADRRVRQEGQFELVRRVHSGQAPKTILFDALDGDRPRMTRIHAVWGLGQLIRSRRLSPESLERLLTFLSDADEEIRVQVARVAGDALHAPRLDELFAAISRDQSARVKHIAATSAGRLIPRGELSIDELRSCRDKLLAALTANKNEDPVLRHGLVMGLTGIGRVSPEVLKEAAARPSRFERLGILLSMRRLHDDGIATFLNDAEPDLILEAARAINDEPMDELTSALAAAIDRPGLVAIDPLIRRAINANFRLGGTEQVEKTARIAADAKTSEAIRVEAARALEDWNSPPELDRVNGSWRPVAPRKIDSIAEQIKPYIAGMFSGPRPVRQAAIRVAGRYGIKDVGPTLWNLFQSADQDAETRIAALGALRAIDDFDLRVAIQLAVDDSTAEVRAAGLKLLAAVDPQDAIPRLRRAVDVGAPIEKQTAIRALAGLDDRAAESVLLAQLKRLVAGTLEPAVQLDVLESAQARKGDEFGRLVEQFEKSRAAETDPLKRYAVALQGGDADEGSRIFFGRTEASCRRCHRVGGSGGNVGPDLSKVAAERDRAYLLQSIVDPNAKIAKGFETVLLAMDDGKVYAGIVKQEGGDTLTLMQNDGTIVQLDKGAIEDRAVGKSGMPEDLVKQLTLSEIRDLVAFLDTLKQSSAAHGSDEPTE